MPLVDLGDWLDENMRPGVLWYVKRLSANDTQATGGHQAGPYIPKTVIFEAIPSLNKPLTSNPRVAFDLAIDSHGDIRKVRAIWYNQHTRDEVRVTGFGGSSSPLLDPDATGALTVFAFRRETPAEPPECHVWVCDTAVDEDRVEERIGPVEPGRTRTWPDMFADLEQPAQCWLEPDQLPPDWLESFPSGAELIRKVIELRPEPSLAADLRLLFRRDCEYDLFRSLEEAVELPRVREGYRTMEAFLKHAQSILQRRRARAGNSLELHVRRILGEEDLVEGQDFDYKKTSELNKEPDFLFPSAKAYYDPSTRESSLRMLACKTTLRERWRQILEEADRIETKHLLTLQEGVSENQFREIQVAKVQLVVPSRLHGLYPSTVQPHLQTLESFIGDLRLLSA